MGFTIPDKIENRLFINNEFVESSDGKKFNVKSPYSHETVAAVYEATEADTNKAVAAAKAAFPTWSQTEPHERGQCLEKLATLVAQNHEQFAVLDALCMGRPVSSYFDALYGAGFISHYAAAIYAYGKGTTSLNTKGFVNLTFRQPIGVVGAIIPWNVPVIMLAHKIAPSVAAGCTVVLKSSEKAPLSSLKFAQLVQEAGFPPGVVNIISGYGVPAGSTLALHPDIRCVNFTGSGLTGKKIQEMAAKSNLKKVILELGGKSPTLIFEDADITQAAADTAMSIRLVSGQACVANSRIYVHQSVADKFKAEFKKNFLNAQIGDPLDPATTHGPQADEIQYNRVKDFVELGKSKTLGKLEAGGDFPKTNGKGYFINPTIFTDVPEDARTFKEEIFGSVVGINTFTNEKDVLAKANDTEYGLYSAVYTNDISRALRVAKALEAGSVGINCTSPTLAHDMPFGGYKQSGQGREGFGYSLENYLEEKAVFIKIDQNVGGLLG